MAQHIHQTGVHIGIREKERHGVRVARPAEAHDLKKLGLLADVFLLQDEDLEDHGAEVVDELLHVR